ncbi:MAG: FAD-dependent thymidylate synthase [archaeon]
MNVKLAGFNVDIDGINAAKDTLLKNAPKMPLNDRIIAAIKLLVGKEDAISGKYLQYMREANEILSKLTPETISASYARISRDPRPIPELREDARKDVAASRSSNKAIIFLMGHTSIAEHAIFNFDIMGISRRIVETLESKRLCSYTEKSQRYITLEGDFVIPQEIRGTPFEKRFVELVEIQNKFYNKHLPALIAWHQKMDYTDLFDSLKISDKPDKQKGTIEGLGKEDTRYPLSMATEAQVGLTISARNLEVLITMLRSSIIAEERELGERLFNLVDGIAPSVIKYTKPSDYFSKTRKELSDFVAGLDVKNTGSGRKYNVTTITEPEPVKLFTGLRRQETIPAGLLFSSGEADYEACLAFRSHALTEDLFIQLLGTAEKYRGVHDPILREWELGDRVAEFVMSSSAYAQMKRHRMNTLIPQRYLPELGWTTPASIEGTGLKKEFDNIVSKSIELYKDMVKSGLPFQIAEYALTNANRRRVLLDANNRQVHAICSERENLPAQWDIRALINIFDYLISDDDPLTTRMLCGKDRFERTKNEAYKK